MQQQQQQQQQLQAALVGILGELKSERTFGGKANNIDRKSIGGPPDWDSAQEHGFTEWQIKLTAWLVNQDERAMDWLNMARDSPGQIGTANLDRHNFENDQVRDSCKKLNAMLYNILVTKLRGEAFNIVTSVRDGCGFEGWRLLTKRYQPRTPATKRALLKSIFNMKSAKKVEEIENNLLKVEEIFTRYETMSDNTLPEDIKTVILIELCTPDLKEHLEFSSKDVSYKETREAVMAYVERKRSDPFLAMEVGNQEKSVTEEYTTFWSTDGNASGENPEVNYWGWKGKGGGGPKGKGKGHWKGGPKGSGQPKGGGAPDKGGGKGKGGKAAEFQGNCHWCGKWGHPANRCADKDVYMEWVRSVNGKGGVKEPTPQEAYGVGCQHPSESQGGVSSLETPERSMLICSVGKSQVKVQNRFAVLESQDEDVGGTVTSGAGEREVDPRGTAVPEKKKLPETWQPVQAKRWTKKLEINSFERDLPSQVNSVGGDQYMEITIDSGAAENVMPERMAPKVPVQYSEEQAAGVVYTAANGEIMPNRGKKLVPFTTTEGQHKMANMQVTDVNRVLMSVAKVCDAGHSVLFTRAGGVITNLQSGEETKFRRENNVYRMTVKLDNAGFPRQG